MIDSEGLWNDWGIVGRNMFLKSFVLAVCCRRNGQASPAARALLPNELKGTKFNSTNCNQNGCKTNDNSIETICTSFRQFAFKLNELIL